MRSTTISPPPEYLDYIRHGGAVEAFLTCDPGYMRLWPTDKLDEYNSDYQVPEYAPGYFCFGSNGAGELLAFDDGGAVYCLPAIGMEPKYATPVAASWSEFERFIELEKAD